jgi:Fic family protein
MNPPYEITNTILTVYGQITEALGICKSLRLVKPEARLRKQNRIKTIHSSLAIEGNTLGIENISAILDKTPVLGPKKDILEVQNAITAYERLPFLDPFSIKDLLKAHGLLMSGLVECSGNFRNTQVGILKGTYVSHIAPGFDRVPGLMTDLFQYIKKDPDIDIIKSCVFHYEMEFIHPFEDGNGRIGRFWQTRLLMRVNPIFEFVPVEKVIRENQEKYYEALEASDSAGESTKFIEFMLATINTSLRETIDETNVPNADYKKRAELALVELHDWFDRKDYMRVCKGISTATASRDLKQMLEDAYIDISGTGRMTRYKKKSG